MSGTWTIGELSQRATAVLSALPQVNGRVRDVPSERLIRWYTTIGLLDPPLTRRGRVALYGHRHLLQLVAIKRRQADGRTIAQIQTELAGATDATLAAVAQLPPGALPSPPAEPGTTGTVRTAVPDSRFWARRPAEPPGHGGDGAPGPTGRAQEPDRTRRPHETMAITFPDPPEPRRGMAAPAAPERAGTWGSSGAGPSGAGPSGTVPPGAGPSGAPSSGAGLPRSGDARDGGFAEPFEPFEPFEPAEIDGGRAAGRSGEPGGASADPRIVHGVGLTPEVTLLLGAARHRPTDDDLRAIAAAARPLLDVLRERGLRTSRDPDGGVSA